MKHAPFVAIATAAGLMMPATVPAFAQQTSEPARTINLPVELKDPYTAYTVGLIPFYSYAAAAYVGTSRLSWNPSDEMTNAATNQMLVDLGFLAAGIVFAGAGVATNNPGLNIASVVSIVAIPFCHVATYAPFWGQEAVRFNKKQMADSGFASQTIFPAAQKADENPAKETPKLQFTDPAEYRPIQLKLGK